MWLLVFRKWADLSCFCQGFLQTLEMPFALSPNANVMRICSGVRVSIKHIQWFSCIYCRFLWCYLYYTIMTRQFTVYGGRLNIALAVTDKETHSLSSEDGSFRREAINTVNFQQLKLWEPGNHSLITLWFKRLIHFYVLWK